MIAKRTTIAQVKKVMQETFETARMEEPEGEEEEDSSVVALVHTVRDCESKL